MLRAPETGSYNLASFIAAHGAELGLEVNEMKGTDEELVPRLRFMFERRRVEEQRAARAGVLSTVRQLRNETRWNEGRAVLPSAPFFRLASPRTGSKYIRFVGSDINVAVRRQLLQRAGAALRNLQDVFAILDAGGIHLRWGARGQLNLYPQNVKPTESTLVVSLPPRPVSKGLPALLGEIIAELGFGT